MTEPKQAEEKKSELRLEKEAVIDAPIEDVWKALTDPTELTRWFPLEARLLPFRPRAERRTPVADHRRRARQDRGSGRALRILLACLASGSLRQSVGGALARNLSRMI